MIRISMGNVGSGKTLAEVYNFIKNPTNRSTYTNIFTSDIDNIVKIKSNMIFKKTHESTKKDGTPVYKIEFNKEYWESINEPINIVIDEAHTIFNSRRAMSKKNQIMGQFMASARRVVGSANHGYGELVLITQLGRRIDPIARDMAHQIRYHVCYWKTYCDKCKSVFVDHSENPEPYFACVNCGCHDVQRRDFYINIWHFKSFCDFNSWYEMGNKKYYSMTRIDNAERIFKNYNTHQWEDLFDEV